MSIPDAFLVPYLCSNALALVLLILAIVRPTAARALCVLLFAGAAFANTRMTLADPDTYLDYGALTTVPLYRHFIYGWFAHHIAPMVLSIAAGQAAIAVLLTRSGLWRRLGVLGACTFLLAIAPLGIGSAFPFSLIVVGALLLTERTGQEKARAPRRILVVQGHPDPRGGHFGHALADAYVRGARETGHEVRLLSVACLDFPLLRTREAFESGAPPEAIVRAQDDLRWADHLAIFFPLWLGTVPALLKAFLEQLFRPELTPPKRPLAGKSARVVVTMGMPAPIYRWYFGAHGLRSLERSILAFCGFRPVRDCIIGMVEGSPAAREKWLSRMCDLGARAQ